MSVSLWVSSSEVIHASGDDIGWYLDGQLSVVSTTLEMNQAKRGLLLDPDGSLVAPVTVMRSESGYDIFTPSGVGEDVKNRLERFRLRTKVSFEVDSACVVGLVAEDQAEVGGSLIRMVSLVTGVTSIPMKIGNVWTNSLYCFEQANYVTDCLAEFQSPRNGEFSRILAAQPRWGREMNAGMNPTELGRSYIRSRADFEKGCYTGQELIERVDSRGYNSPRKMSNFVFWDGDLGDRAPELGTVVSEGKPVITLTSIAYTDDHRAGVGLGFQHRLKGEFETEIMSESIKIKAVELGCLSSNSGSTGN